MVQIKPTNTLILCLVTLASSWILCKGRSAASGPNCDQMISTLTDAQSSQDSESMPVARVKRRGTWASQPAGQSAGQSGYGGYGQGNQQIGGSGSMSSGSMGGAGGRNIEITDALIEEETISIPLDSGYQSGYGSSDPSGGSMMSGGRPMMGGAGYESGSGGSGSGMRGTGGYRSASQSGMGGGSGGGGYGTSSRYEECMRMRKANERAQRAGGSSQMSGAGGDSWGSGMMSGGGSQGSGYMSAQGRGDMWGSGSMQQQQMMGSGGGMSGYEKGGRGKMRCCNKSG